MVVLTLVAVLAGAGTALSPCVLPVLPALLSATGVGGRRRPLGVVVGLAITFTLSVALLARAVEGVGLGDATLRSIAIAVVAVFGVTLLVPGLAARIEAPLARLSRLGPRRRGDGFWSGVGVGAALGFVYVPCTGPVLGAIVSIGATTGTSLRTLVIAAAYALGAAAVLLALALGGRRVLDRARRAFGGPAVQRALGAVLLATAAAMVANLDIRVEQSVARHIPDANLAAALERSPAVDRRLAGLRPPSRFARATHPGSTAALPRYGPAPDFAGTQRWFNTDAGRPLTLTALRGRVVLVDFWTYTCINCLRTLPYLEAWDRRYRAAGLTIVGVHSPEFTFERDAGNVADAIRAYRIRYPVAQDNRLATWSAWGNQYWPAEYLIDAHGIVRHAHFGEGEYGATERLIRTLLAERGDHRLGGRARPRGVVTPTSSATPETYLGAARAQGFTSRVTAGTRRFARPARLGVNRFAYSGTWTIGQEVATAGSRARLDARVVGRAVYVVLGASGSGARQVRVLLDGRPIPARDAGADVQRSVLTVGRHRLYRIVALHKPEQHVLTLEPDAGVQGYAFTFG